MRRLGVFVVFFAAVIFLSFNLIFGDSKISKPAMILVPAGTFQMGSPDFERSVPVHKVTLANDFYMSRHEITNQQFADILNYAFSKGYLDENALSEGSKKRVAKGVSKSPQVYQDVFDEDSQIIFEDGKFKPFKGKENYPIVEITWYGAAFYCNMLSELEGLTPLYNIDDWSCKVYGKTGYRLPTEAEWEYAAKYNDSRKYPWGNQKPDESYANIKGFVGESTYVGKYSPAGDSKLGISDMAGNVAEWCNDWYNEYSSGDEEIDPIGPPPSLYVYLPVFKQFQPLRVIRGGSYLYDANFRKGMGAPFIIDCVVYEDSINNSFRSFDYKTMSRNVIGFRVVKSVATEATIPKVSTSQ